jgi:octanoyl-[GcvH]:protein N-octanoyltransferase
MKKHWNRLFVFAPIELYRNERIADPFLQDEWLSHQVQSEGDAIVHFWRCDVALVIGQRDRQMPGIDRAVVDLANEWIPVLVRQSGGAAVPLDEGVLNVSFVFPNDSARFAIDDDFHFASEVMTKSILQLTPDADIRVGEISGSYCPGRIDLSIGGRKFCGISQRRYARATIVQAFLNVTGVTEQRTSVARRFYDLADYFQNNDFSVQSEKLGSLSELCEIDDAAALQSAIISTLQQLFVETNSLDRRPSQVELQHFSQKICNLTKEMFEKDGNIPK